MIEEKKNLNWNYSYPHIKRLERQARMWEHIITTKGRDLSEDIFNNDDKTYIKRLEQPKKAQSAYIKYLEKKYGPIWLMKPNF